MEVSADPEHETARMALRKARETPVEGLMEALRICVLFGHDALARVMLERGVRLAKPDLLLVTKESSAYLCAEVIKHHLTLASYPQVETLLERVPECLGTPPLEDAARMAEELNDFVLVRILAKPEVAARHAEQERADIEEHAQVVHVLSTRFGPPAECPKALPLPVSDYVKAKVEAMAAGKQTKVFNPNRDNAALEGGDTAKANAIWLLTWRRMLKLAKKRGGKMVRLDMVRASYDKTGSCLSAMQEAETDMAADIGVEVVAITFDCEGEELTDEHKRQLDEQIEGKLKLGCS